MIPYNIDNPPWKPLIGKLVYCIDSGTSMKIHTGKILSLVYNLDGTLEKCNVVLGKDETEIDATMPAVISGIMGHNHYFASEVFMTMQEAEKERFLKLLGKGQ